MSMAQLSCETHGNRMRCNGIGGLDVTQYRVRDAVCYLSLCTNYGALSIGTSSFNSRG